MKWIIALSFLEKDDGSKWLGAFVPGTRHTFDLLGAGRPLEDSRKTGHSRTPAQGWVGHFRQAWTALRTARRQQAGVITCFPQLPVAAGLLSYVFPGRRTKIIAWTFNIGKLPGGLRRRLSTLALRRVDAFIVHSLAEIDECSECFSIDRDKFLFAPLQRVLKPLLIDEDRARPYAIALGSANRDYRLLFAVLRRFPIRTIIVASDHALAGLEVPPNVEVRSGLSPEECHALLQASRMSIVPVANATTASGQVTLLDSMGMGRATIVTRCPGSTEYVVDGETAILVEAGDESGLATAVQRLWQDDAFRERLGRQGREHVSRNFSDEAIGRIMGRVCDAVEEGIPVARVAL